MVVNRKFNSDYVSTWEIYGKSTETKPTMANGVIEENIPHMSVFVEMDTGDGFYYDKDLDAWTEIGG